MKLRIDGTTRRATQLSPYRPFHIRVLEHRLTWCRLLSQASLASRTTPVLHDHLVDKITAHHAAPGTNVIGFPALYDIQRIEWIDRVHETMTAPTDYPIHGAAS
ncbi:MAG: hypothetical protein ABL950_08300 [Nitrospira sp.]